MPYCYGSNIAGYLPERDVYYVATFDDAKAGLISDLLFDADDEDDADYADELSGAAGDVNLWSGADYLYTQRAGEHQLPCAWWIHEVSDEEYEQNDPDGYEEYADASRSAAWCEIHHAPHTAGGLACELRQAEDILG